MIYTNKPYTNTTKGGATDAKKKYLNIEKMSIQRKTILNCFSLLKKSIAHSFKIK
jgi:hypothetical protein